MLCVYVCVVCVFNACMYMHRKQKVEKGSLLAGLNRRPFAYKANALPLS